jgi:hypothetical protein
MELGRLLILGVLPATVVASLLEACILSRHEEVDWKALVLSVLNFVVRNIVLVALPLSIASPLFRWAWEHRLTTMRVDSWVTIALLFLTVWNLYTREKRPAVPLRVGASADEPQSITRGA